ncbi:Aldose 1-epimerase [Rhodovastum atsumiense]|nr:aldose 1-epimerase [Rhodovastum atsumiense]CAH2604641.1 Aldose 1-epimerase [Rhodovastum atsumiense]
MTELLEIAAGDCTLTLAPEIGGAIASWTRGDVSILRPVQEDALAQKNARGLGCFPLFPFSGRVAGRRFPWRGMTHELPALLDGAAIHGAGWKEPWRVADADPDDAILVLDHIPGPLWPFSFRAEQNFELQPDRLICDMEITNTHTHAAPVAFGLHPYFPRTPGCTLQFQAGGVWRKRPGEAVPGERTAVPAEWDHSTARAPVEGIDDCFVDWTRPVRLTWPEAKLALTITADPVFRHLVVYVPPGRDYFCVEPVSNMNDGLNRLDGKDHGFTVLESGDTLRGRVTFTLETL